MQGTRLVHITPAQRIKIKKIIPNIISLMNGCAGFMSILCTLHNTLVLAGVFICVAMLLDACDGRIARKLHATSNFGLELDSLCDVVSFVIAPPLIIYALAAPRPSTMLISALFAFVVAGLFRLARFNTTSYQQSRYFVGIPAPLGSLLLITLIPFIMAHSYAGWPSTALIYAIAGGMMSRLRIPSFK